MRALATAGLLSAASTAGAAASPGMPELSVEATVGATDHGAAATGGGDQADLPVLLRPRLRLERAGPFTLHLDAAALVAGSAAGRAPLRAWPDVAADARAELVERLLSIDAGARLRPVAVDPFGVRPSASETGNQRTEQAWRIGPVLRAEPWNGGLLLARRIDSWTLDNAGTRDDLRGARTELALVHAPAPVGGGLALTRLASRIAGIGTSAFTLDTARASLSAAPDPEVELGVDAGADRTHTPGRDDDAALWALRASWQPSERTGVSALLESRFFGRGGTLLLHERTPWMSLQLEAAREPFLAAQAVDAPLGDSRSALDRILTTRWPDPVARQRVVEALVRGLGLDGGAFSPVGVQAPYPQLETRTTVAWTLLGPRSSVSLAFYDRADRMLRRHGQALVDAAAADDTRQRGVSLQAARTLEPGLALDLSWQLTRIAGLGDDDAPRSTESVARVWVTRQLSVRAAVTFGGQWLRLRSTQAGDDRPDAVLVFVGIVQRF
jgi:uncharacterized protein (PEP-CTERM system associated)